MKEYIKVNGTEYPATPISASAQAKPQAAQSCCNTCRMN